MTDKKQTEKTSNSSYLQDPVFKYGLLFGCLLLGVSSFFHSDAEKSQWYSIIPPLFAVFLAIITHKLIPSLIVAIFLGGLLKTVPSSPLSIQSWFEGAANGFKWTYKSTFDPDHLLILAFIVPVLAMISVIVECRGFEGLILRFSKLIKGPKSALFFTYLMGIAIFIDDYANTLIVGSSMKPITDKYGISREKLAFIVDATSAPVAGIAVVSTWIGYEVGLFNQMAQTLNLGLDGYAMFFDALGFRFYCFFMLAFVLINIIVNYDFGPMLKAERSKEARDRKFQKRVDEGERLQSEGYRPLARVAVIPITSMLFLLFTLLWLDGNGAEIFSKKPMAIFSFTSWRMVISASENSIKILAIVALFSFCLSVIVGFASRSINLERFKSAVFKGVKTSLLPMFILILAWALKEVCGELRTGDYLVSSLSGELNKIILPITVFLFSGLIAFSTGTSWGTMAILIPTMTPLAYSYDGNTYGLITMICLGAILDGAIFGDHCSPISDTTVLSSMASGCDHISHVKTQLPYALLVGLQAMIFGYLPAAFGVPSWIGFVLGIMLMLLVLILLKGRRESQPEVQT